MTGDGWTAAERERRSAGGLAPLTEEQCRLLDNRLRERGLSRADLAGTGAVMGNGGAALGIPYLSSDGVTVWRLLILAKSKGGGNLQWVPGSAAKGAVWVLGDAQSARTVVVCEGESDALAAWRHLRSFGGSSRWCASPGRGWWVTTS